MNNVTNSQQITSESQPYIPKKYGFAYQQAMAFTFLKAFYNSQELGYNVDRYQFTDVTQDIIDIVNDMAYQILATAKIAATSAILLKASEIILAALAQKKISKRDILTALFDIISNNSILSSIQIVLGMQVSLKEIREVIRFNALANTAFILILNREKGNIELKFNGF